MSLPLLLTQEMLRSTLRANPLILPLCALIIPCWPDSIPSHPNGRGTMSGKPFRVFISAVSSEFQHARSTLASDLRALGLEVRVQEDFRQEIDADTTLQKLHNYIRDCDAVIYVLRLLGWSEKRISAEIDKLTNPSTPQDSNP